jgi:hypothetical protein
VPGSNRTLLTLPVRNSRPDGRPVAVDVYWGDALRGRVTLPPGSWKRIELAVPSDESAVLRIRVVPPFRPASRRDPRMLGVQTGSGPSATAAP